jgi:hypothetical protein
MCQELNIVNVEQLDTFINHPRKELTTNKWPIWLEEIRKNADSSEEMSWYSLLQNILTMQDKMVILVRDKQTSIK